MRLSLIFLACLAFSGCVGGYVDYGVEPQPPITQTIHKQSSVEGSGLDGGWHLFGQQISYDVRWSGKGTITFQWPAKPHVIFDGDLAVSPVPGLEAATHQAISDGRMAVRRGGQPAALVSPGSLE